MCIADYSCLVTCVCVYIYRVIRRFAGSAMAPGSPRYNIYSGHLATPGCCRLRLTRVSVTWRLLVYQSPLPITTGSGLNRALTTQEKGPPISTLITLELALFSYGSNRCVTFFVLPVILCCTDVNTFSPLNHRACTGLFMHRARANSAIHRKHPTMKWTLFPHSQLHSASLWVIHYRTIRRCPWQSRGRRTLPPPAAEAFVRHSPWVLHSISKPPLMGVALIC